MLPHKWSAFSTALMQEIDGVICDEKNAVKWARHPELASPEEEFRAEGTVSFHLTAEFTLRFGTKILDLERRFVRWSTFLADKRARDEFVCACDELCQFAGAQEVLLLPEATILMDSLYRGDDFEHIKVLAGREWGAADLDIRRIYTFDEIKRMSTKRVHYMLVTRTDLSRARLER